MPGLLKLFAGASLTIAYAQTFVSRMLTMLRRLPPPFLIGFGSRELRLPARHLQGNHTQRTAANLRPSAATSSCPPRGRAIAAACIVGVMLGLCSFPCHAQSPQIESVSQITTQQIQTIVITGSGFGTQSPYTGNSAYIALFDLTNGGWQAGNVGSLEGVYENDGVTLIVKSWTDSQIVLGGFSGSWGQNSLGETPSGSWTLRVGDQEQIDVWNAQSGNGAGSITTTVVAAPAVTLTVGPASLPAAASHVTYSAQLTASGGTAPYSFAVVSGSLPTGLTLSSNGLMTGTPAQTGTGTFTVQVKDAAGNTGQITYAVSVGSPLVGGMNLALGKAATQSSTFPGYASDGASSAVDGNTDGNFSDGSVTATNLDPNPWWEVDLGASAAVSSIVIWNRTDCCGSRLGDYWVFVSDTPFLATDTPATLQFRAGTFSSHQTSAPNPSTTMAGAQGRYVRVQLSFANYLSLAEVQVFGH